MLDRKHFISLMLILVSAFIGCGDAANDDSEDVSEANDAIIDGTVVSPENSGHVLVGGCSGTLINNEWVLTAAHCNPAVGAPIQMGSQSAAIAETIKHPLLDVMLLRLATPLWMGGSSIDYGRQFVMAGPSSGQDLDCYGYGFSTFDDGFGTLRTARMTVDSIDVLAYHLKPNGSSQIPWKGDSGGSCFDLSGRLMGVQSWGNYDNKQVLEAHQVNSLAFWSWARSTVYGHGASAKWHDSFCLPGEHCEIADVNGDGRGDLVTFIKSTRAGADMGDVFVGINNGTSFGPPHKWHDYFCVGGEHCAVTDLNADGRADLVTFVKSTQAGTGFGDVWVALSTGTGFGGATKWHDYFCVGSEECQVADLNGDRRGDLVVFIKDAQSGDNRGDVWVALNTGTGFGPASKWHDYFCVGAEQCRVGDINGDSKADVITFIKDTQSGAGRGDVWVALSTGTGFGPASKWHEFFCIGAEECNVADVSGDGKADLLIFIKDTQSGQNRGDVWISESSGTAFGPYRKSHDYHCVGNEVCRVGQVNNDGRADLVAFIQSSQTGAAANDVWVALASRLSLF